MNKLFACYLGGRIPGCHIEMHDVQFSVGERIEDCYDDLKEKRVGGETDSHIDAFLELKYVDGYEISLERIPQEDVGVRIYFVNAGAYDPKKFGELHEIGFYVTESRAKATKKALQVLCSGQDKRHQDDLYDVDDCIAIEQVSGRHIHLHPTTKKQDFEPMYYGYGTFDKQLSEKIKHKNY